MLYISIHLHVPNYYICIYIYAHDMFCYICMHTVWGFDTIDAMAQCGGQEFNVEVKSLVCRIVSRVPQEASFFTIRQSFEPKPLP